MATRSRHILLPPFAREYLKLCPASGLVVQSFHAWLQDIHRSIAQLEPNEVEQFFAIIAISPRSRVARTYYRSDARHYLIWLHRRKLLKFAPGSRWSKASAALPNSATRFVQFLAPTRKPSTIGQYRASLGQFHDWLTSRARALDQLERDDLDAWLQWLHQRGLHPSSRLHLIQQVRAYLKWLQDQGALSANADSLILSSDLPKLPQYLPRPLPPDIDALLQKRLRKSSCPHQLGLLLMRSTGLRIGELLKLSHQCLRHDTRGHSFLKVPLGKLDTERLVPLDAKTLSLVRRLQRLGEGHRSFLLESGRRPIPYSVMQAALRKACHGLSTPEPITTHRLRHTYATTLLAGGMSLPAIMRLLGHRDYRMTLRYAAITDETVVIEYHQALRSTEQRYDVPSPADAPPTRDPLVLLLDVIRFVQKSSHDRALDPQRTRLLVKRIRRLHADIKRLFTRPVPPLASGKLAG
jgi:site-specific recombinase XerD